MASIKQGLEQKLQQKLSPLQIQTIKLIEMPVQALEQHVREVLEQVGMETKAYKKPYELSGGEQQRVVIARALMNSPEIILADEPTGNLDAETGQEIMELLYSICQAGITVLMSTHNRLWPELYPGKKWIFDRGEIKDGD